MRCHSVGSDQACAMSEFSSASMNAAMRHVPVLLRQVVDLLAPQSGDVIIDGTFGAGGYTRAILESADTHVIAIDRDPTAIAAATSLVRDAEGRLTIVENTFGKLDEIAAEQGHAHVDGVVLDIGVSSMQLDQAERGFSFQTDGPLDMRMARAGTTAADLVNTLSRDDLARVLYLYGEEKKSRRIADAIVARRTDRIFETTHDLASLIAEVLPRNPARKGPDRHPATRTFQALRIAVNDELGELICALFAAERVLRPGGRLAVVTFHSLEDRIVKRFLRARSSSRPRASRHAPDAAGPDASFEIINPSALKPDEEEVNANPRARSATLRGAVRTAAPAHPAEVAGLGLPKVVIPSVR